MPGFRALQPAASLGDSGRGSRALYGRAGRHGTARHHGGRGRGAAAGLLVSWGGGEPLLALRPLWARPNGAAPALPRTGGLGPAGSTGLAGPQRKRGRRTEGEAPPGVGRGLRGWAGPGRAAGGGIPAPAPPGRRVGSRGVPRTQFQHFTQFRFKPGICTPVCPRCLHSCIIPAVRAGSFGGSVSLPCSLSPPHRRFSSASLRTCCLRLCPN